MGNLKSIDSRVVGRCLFCTWLGASIFLAVAAFAQEKSGGRYEAWSRPHLMLAQNTSSESVQNIQRLLKLLSDRYSARYGAVDPGRLDGTMGAGTRNAIRKFQEISGTVPGSQTNEQLVASILATLARMSADHPAESDTPDAVQTADAKPAPTADKPAEDKPAADKPETAKSVEAALNAPPAVAETPSIVAGNRPKPSIPAPIPPAKGPAPAAAPPETLIITQTSGGKSIDRVYFVQAASLRSLEAAKREWQRIFEENRAALTGEQIYFEEATIADRGTFYRILVGPISEREAAKTLCSFLKQNDQPCVVTSRNRKDLPLAENKSSKAQPATDPEPTPGENPAAATETLAQEPPPAKPAAAAPPLLSPDLVFKLKPGAAANAKSATPSVGPGQATPDGAVAMAPEKAGQGDTPPKQPDPAARDETPDAPATSKTKKDVTTAVPAPASSPPGSNSLPPSSPGTNAPPAASSPPESEPAAKAVTPAAPASQTDSGGSSGNTGSKPAAKPEPTAAPAAPQETSSLPPAVAALLNRLGGMNRALGLVAALIAGSVILLFLWRRRNRQSALAQIFQSANFAFARLGSNASHSAETLSALETDFESEQLRASRSIRDEFLRDILGDRIDIDDTLQKEEPAIKINSSLKSLLISDPAQYKSIFLNWIFLSKVGAALNQQEITMEELNGHFGREFKLLQNYFKIHLLELDDRHRIRKELPGLFYCLQLAQQRQRPTRHTA